MARSQPDIVDSDTTLFLLAPEHGLHYAARVMIDTISHDCCGIHITLHGPLYDMAKAMAHTKGEFAFTLAIQNNLCGQADYYNGKQTIISIEGCEVIAEYLENVVKLNPCENINILMMYADITAEKVTIYDYDSGEEILTWHAQS